MIALLLALLPLQAQIQTDPSLPGLGNKVQRLEWLQDAGFGMFIHFSLDSQVGSVISHTLVGSSHDYRKWFFEELPRSGFTWWDSQTTDAHPTARTRSMITRGRCGARGWPSASTTREDFHWLWKNGHEIRRRNPERR